MRRVPHVCDEAMAKERLSGAVASTPEGRSASILFPFQANTGNQSSYAEEIDGEWLSDTAVGRQENVPSKEQWVGVRCMPGPSVAVIGSVIMFESSEA